MSILTAHRAEAVAALADPVRRDLFRLAARGPLRRDEAADALGLPLSTAALHLDRLVEAGLLTVEFRRLTGRSGPGAGRPAKLYRAVSDELAASIPQRHYELVGDLLASAVERADELGVPVREAVAAAAFDAGAAIGAGSDGLEEALDACGYAPRAKGAPTGNGPEAEASVDLVLENCPFHALASRHTALVCGANVDLVRGLAAATGDERTPVLAPSPGRCCVEIRTVRGDGNSG